MFCPECGTELSDAAAFCRKCGASLREDAGAPTQPVTPVGQTPIASQPVAQQPAPGTWQATPSPVVAQPRPAPRTLGAMKPVQPVIGVLAIAGGAIAAIGSFLPWIKIESQSSNGFDIGYITDSTGGGNDGLIILILGLAAAAVAVHYFRNRNQLLSLAGLVLGVAVAGVAGYNFIKVYKDLHDLCGGNCSPTDYISYGLYMGVAGGAVAAVASFFGMKQEGGG